jgi:hypothetical protein
MASGSVTIAANGKKFVDVSTPSGTGAIKVGTESSDTFDGRKSFYTGVRFYSTSTFYALAQIDADGSGLTYDWGFPLLPSKQLTSQVLVGMGVGCTNLPCTEQEWRRCGHYTNQFHGHVQVRKSHCW